MPKLKKHSERKSKNKKPKENEQINNYQQDASEDQSLNANLVQPRKMKMRQRIKIFEGSQEQDDKKTQKRLPKPNEESNQIKDNNQVEIIFSKFTDDDIDTADDRSCPPQKQKKTKKNQIKTRNKMFSAFQLQETKQKSNVFSCHQSEEFQLQVNKKQRRESGSLLDKVDQRVNNFKKKMQYKDLNKDHKYKKQIKDKLKSIEEAQQINISVQVPKVFGGKNAHLDAAIFLKNKNQLTTQDNIDNIIRQSSGQEESKILKDRRQYYQELGKKMKLKKAETLTENILKECFKKSQLQDFDFLPDLGFQNSRRESFDGNNQSCSIQKLKLNEDIKKSSSFSESSISNKSSISNTQVEQKKIESRLPQAIKQKQENQLESNQSKHLQEVKKQAQPFIENNQKNFKLKAKRYIKSALKKNFKFSKYVQLQADISDDEEEGGPKHKDEGDDLSDDQEETQISSLIDDSAEFDSKDRDIIHRKYFQDMIEKDEQQQRQMKQRMEKKYLQQKDNLRKRMKQAALKNKQKQQEQQSISVDQLPQLNQNQQSKSQSSSKLKNEAKLKQLEQRLQLKKKQAKQPAAQTDIGKLKEIQAAVRITTVGPIKKAVRNGLQSMVLKQKQKSKPKK